MAWDVMSGVTKMAWDVMSGVTKTGWDVLSGVANLCGMFCPGCKKMAWDVLSRDVLSNTNKMHVLQGLNHNPVRYIFTTKELAGDISTVNALNFQTKVNWLYCLDKRCRPRVLNVCY